MTPEEESDRIRALLRAAHRDDDLSCPPFQRLVREAEPRQHVPRPPWTVRAAALTAIAAAASVVLVLSLRGERTPPPLPTLGALAWSSGAWGGPLDFLLELPNPPPLEALPSLRASLPVYRSGSDSRDEKRR